MQDVDAVREPSVVSIVLNWNGWVDTIECLESLLQVPYRSHHIVVCDNGSHDGSIDHLSAWAAASAIPYVSFDSIDSALAGSINELPALIFIQTGENLGYGGGNNVGIRFALQRLDATYVWILNNDTVVERDALDGLVRFAEQRPDVAIVGARLIQYFDPERIQALGGGRFQPILGRDVQLGRGRLDHRLADRAIELDHVVGASMLVRAAAVKRVGLIDESYFLYREETDWCIRMRRQGWHLAYCPQSVVLHKEGRSSGFKSLLHDYYSVRNMLYLIARFYPHALATAFVASMFYTIVPKLVRLRFRRLAIVLRAYFDFLRGRRGKQIDPDAMLSPTVRRGPAQGLPQVHHAQRTG